jgi:hypothetical protein
MMLVDLKDSVAAKFLPPLIQEFRYGKKVYSVFDASLRIPDYESLVHRSYLSICHNFHGPVVPDPFINICITL